MSVIDLLKKNFASSILDSNEKGGFPTVIIAKEKSHELLKFLRDNSEYPFNMLLDVCGVDYLGQSVRFEVVYHLYSFAKKMRIRVRVKVPENDLTVKSAIDIWEAADWFEREAYDMFGIKFDGHPNLKRLLMWEAFEGHPLRKDYPLEKRQAIPEPADLL
ncbi:NADH-quinone oxidoreductase subunit C [bacterium]|nr:NADH-quinone oxidoreductase subunit C [bacterium]